MLLILHNKSVARRPTFGAIPRCQAGELHPAHLAKASAAQLPLAAVWTLANLDLCRDGMQQCASAVSFGCKLHQGRRGRQPGTRIATALYPSSPHPHPPLGVICQSLSGTESSQDSVLLVSWLVGCTGDAGAAGPLVPPVATLRGVRVVEDVGEGCRAASSTA